MFIADILLLVGSLEIFVLTAGSRTGNARNADILLPPGYHLNHALNVGTRKVSLMSLATFLSVAGRTILINGWSRRCVYVIDFVLRAGKRDAKK